MLLTLTTWSLIAHQFTEQERAAINRAITGETVSGAKGCRLNEDRLGPELTAKLRAAISTTL